MLHFPAFQAAIAKRFEIMRGKLLFRADVAGDLLWQTYLDAFPQGSNPMYRKRTEHDCSCCKNFIRSAGNIVAIESGRPVSIWNIAPLDGPNSAYNVVAEALDALVKAAPIGDVFLHYEGSIGTARNYERRDGEDVMGWDHFHIQLPNSIVTRKADIATKLGEAQQTRAVLRRGVTEITAEAIDTVLELIRSNALYRGSEHEHAVAGLMNAQRKVLAHGSQVEQEGIICVLAATLPFTVSRVRNNAIGTLLVDLSNGRDVDAAVAAFERMVAPANYRRPTAVVTKSMVERARTDIAALGLTSALERRYATLADVSVNDVLFANRAARKRMRHGDIFDTLAAEAPGGAVDPRTFKDVETVMFDEFVAAHMLQATSVEVLFENRHAGNLVSLIAPADPAAPGLFQWPNTFSWSYAGDFADSVKERVKKAGGNVTGDLCCRLAWSNHDDLDFHMREPNYEIFFVNKGVLSPNGGVLDVDMNAGGGTTREPVENITYASAANMRSGIYRLVVHQFARRETISTGFEVEVDILGVMHRFKVDKSPSTNYAVAVATITRGRDGSLSIESDLSHSTAVAKPQQRWNLNTCAFHEVTAITPSPNHWAGLRSGIGNLHWFFMLRDCRNDGSARGFYNEFLKPELSKHRKTLELVGSRMRTEEAGEQMSGLGFSSTKRDDVVVRLRNADRGMRVLRITF